MAASLLLSPLPASTAPELVGSSSGFLPKRSFLANSSNILLLTNPITRRRRPLGARYTISASSSNYRDHFLKCSEEENLDHGLMEYYKDEPGHLYGLPSSVLKMFMTENNPFERQAERVTEESLSSLRCLNNMNAASSRMSSTMFRGAGRRPKKGSRDPRDRAMERIARRIVFLGLPIVPPVAKLIIAELLHLDRRDSSKPIYLHINYCTGTQNEKGEIVGSETDAYAIADAMRLCKSRICTVNWSMAYGQAAMLLSLGTPGHRIVLPHSFTKIYMPSSIRSTGNASDLWPQATDMYANVDSYIDLLAKGTGKDKEELAKDIQSPRLFGAQETIDYGLADRIAGSKEIFAEKKKKYGKRTAKSKAKEAFSKRVAAGFR